MSANMPKDRYLLVVACSQRKTSPPFRVLLSSV